MQTSLPQRYGPPKRESPSSNKLVRRASSATTGSGQGASPLSVTRTPTFMERSVRTAEKPECISAETDIAKARAALSRGHASGASSAQYMQIASESQTTTSPWCRAGTLPVGENFLRSSTRSEPGPRATRTSLKGIPHALRRNQGRSDHDE
eukprot:Amastigsp_a680092_21.p4 type:complete len:151 gc:universal Amastigsp_a680092_21:256-708(+)